MPPTASSTTAPPATPASPPAPGALPATPPGALLWDLSAAAVGSRCLHAVAQLGVADALPPEGGTVEALAAALRVDADALGRVLRALAVHGVFEVDLPHVRHTPPSLLLRRDHPASMGPFAAMMGLPFAWDALALLPSTVTTGRSGITELDPDGLFGYLAAHPDERAVFDLAMTAKSHGDIAAVLEAHDFGAHHVVADVGGGRGHLLDAVLARHPDVRGALVELPEVIARTTPPATDRLRLVPADFFIDELPAADCYVLMEIIHDWGDADAVRILANIRRCAPADAVVLLVEAVLGDDGPSQAATLDVLMLSVTGGRERTPDAYAALLHEAGFDLTAVVRTRGSVTIVQARPA